MEFTAIFMRFPNHLDNILYGIKKPFEYYILLFADCKSRNILQLESVTVEQNKSDKNSAFFRFELQLP